MRTRRLQDRLSHQSDGKRAAAAPLVTASEDWDHDQTVVKEDITDQDECYAMTLVARETETTVLCYLLSMCVFVRDPRFEQWKLHCRHHEHNDRTS